MSPDVFLSSHGIRYDGSMLPGTPSEIVQAFRTINQTRRVNPETGMLENIQYQTPNFHATATNPNTFNPRLVYAQSTTMNALLEAIRAGSIAAVHRLTDALNSMRQESGGVEFVPPFDVDILANRADRTGEVLRVLNDQRARFAEGSQMESGSPIPWFDSVEAYHAIEALTPKTASAGAD